MIMHNRDPILLPSAREYPRRRLPFAVLAMGSALTVLATVYVQRISDIQTRSSYRNAVENLQDALKGRVDAALTCLRAASGLFAGSNEVTARDFTLFATEINLRGNFPGVQGLGYSARIDGDLPAFYAAQRRIGNPAVKVWPDMPGTEAHSIIYLQPMDKRNAAALGFNMFSQPVRRAAMEAARDSGRPAASGRVSLVQEIDANKQAGFLIYLPIYRRGMARDSVDERREALQGFVYSPFRAGDFLSGLFGSEHERRIDVAIYDGDAADEDALLYRSAPMGDRRPLLRTTHPLNVAGRSWTIETWSRPNLEAASSRWIIPYVFGAGALTTLFLFLAMRFLAVRSAEAEKSAAEAEASNERFRLVSQATHDVIWDWDMSSDSLYWNDMVTEVFGLTRDALGTRITGWTERIHPDDRETVLQSVQNAIVNGASHWSAEYRFRRADGSYPVVLDRGYVLRAADGRPVRMIGSMVDVTDRKRYEIRLREQADELRRSNDELEQFAYVSSHDLKEPLRKISSYVDLLSSRVKNKLDPGEEKYFDNIVGSTIRMKDLIDGLLSYSRAGRGEAHKEPIDVAALLGQVLNELEPQISEAGAEVTHGPMPTVPADRLLIRQLFQNLISNAVKFRGDEPPRIHVSAEPIENGWRFSVTDNGIGFDAQHNQQIFKIFQRLHGRGTYPGTGIGLAICRRIVERHGGEIGAESRPGEGSTFWFTLPAERPREASPSSTSSADIPAGHTAHHSR